MNAVKYGSTKDKSIVHIYFTYNDKEVEFHIEDDGTGSRATTVEKLRLLINQNANQNDVTKTSGRGLAMITTLWTDKLEIEESRYGGMAISFVKSIETQPPPPPKLVKSAILKSAESLEPIKQSKEKEIEQKKPQGPSFIVKLQGKIDQLNIDKLALPVNEQIKALPENGVLILDFAELDYINSTFIGLLASWLKDVQRKDGQIILQNTNHQIKDVLDLVGLGKVLNIE